MTSTVICTRTYAQRGTGIGYDPEAHKARAACDAGKATKEAAAEGKKRLLGDAFVTAATGE